MKIQKNRERLDYKNPAFTLAEAILTMMILGILAATMVTTLKPQQYKDQAFNTLKKKIFTEIDNVTQTILTECINDMKLSAIYDNCDVTATTHSFSTGENAIYARYMKGTTGEIGALNGTCPAEAGFSSIKLKNGVCVYFGLNTIRVDINGSEGPNEDGSDRMQLSVGENGITNDIDGLLDANWTEIASANPPALYSCEQFGRCLACNSGGCTKCTTGFGIDSGGNCKSCNITYCKTCSGGTCTACIDGYRLNGSTCTACTRANCKICNASACTECNDGYWLSGSNCVSCATNCKTCTGSGAQLCTECMHGYRHVSTTNRACTLCTLNDQSPECNNNQSYGCLAWDDENGCTECDYNTNVLLDHRCGE